MKVVVGSVALIAVVATSVAAQPSEEDRKSPQVATVLAWGGFLAAPALSLATLTLDMGQSRDRHIAYTLIGVESGLMVLGPSAGHWYAHQFSSPGLLIRTGSAALLATGFVGLVGCVQPDASCTRYDAATWVTAGGMTLGTVGMIVGTLIDVMDAPQAARRWNRERGLEPILAPMVTPNGGGLSLAGRF